MGADTRFPTPQTDPDHPSPAVTAMMRRPPRLRDLARQPAAAGDLAARRGRRRPRSIAKDWTNSALCASCHSQIFKDWSNSTHHFMGQSDPYYAVLEDLAAKTEGEPLPRLVHGLPRARRRCFPARPRRPTGPRICSTATAQPRRRAQGLRPTPSTRAPAACSATASTRSRMPAGSPAATPASNVSLADRPLYPGENFRLSRALRAFAGRLIRARPDVHAASLMRHVGDATRNSAPPAMRNSRRAPAPTSSTPIRNGRRLRSTRRTTRRRTAPASIATCMPTSPRSASTCRAVRPTAGRCEANVVSHDFVGAQYHLVGLRDPAGGAPVHRAAERRRRSCRVTEPANGTLTVRVANVGAGHGLPTGVSDFRQMWLDVTATDANGEGRAYAPAASMPGAMCDPMRGSSTRCWPTRTAISSGSSSGASAS